MIEPTEEDVGKRVKYTQKGWFGKPDIISHGTLTGLGNGGCVWVQWDGKDSDWSTCAFAKELDWSRSKKKNAD